jgi:hypothetical protein
MYWISPMDFKLHHQLLTYLGSGGFDVDLRAIGSKQTFFSFRL